MYKKLDKNNYKKDTTVCEDCFKKRKKSNNIFLIQNQQPKFDNVIDIKKNYSCGETKPGH